MKLLEGKKAVIRGESEGIGYAMAEGFVENGADSLLFHKNKKLNKAVEKLSIFN